MTVQPKTMTVAEFVGFVHLPENESRQFELINGEVIEKVSGRTRNSEIGHLFAVAVHLFCREHGLPCHTSGGDGAYDVQGNVLAPDFAYKSTPTSDDYPDPNPPELVMEIISPTDKAADIRDKRRIYRQAGIFLIEMYPQSQSADVYAPGQSMKTVGIDGVLDGGDVLPGFTLAMRELFEK